MSSYVLQVLKSYIKPRLWRPRARADLERELHVLASLFPEFAPEFRAIHKAFRLPLPVSMLPVFSSGAAGDMPPRRPTTLYCGFHYLDREPVVRVVSPTIERDPPPPYASEDPDPGSTRLLAMRLAAEDEDEEDEYEADDSYEEVEEGIGLGRPDRSETVHAPAVVVDDYDEDTGITLEHERTISALSFHSLSFELDTALHPAFRFLFAANNEPEHTTLADDDVASEVESLYPPSIGSFDSDFDEPPDVECCSMMATEDAD